MKQERWEQKTIYIQFNENDIEFINAIESHFSSVDGVEYDIIRSREFDAESAGVLLAAIAVTNQTIPYIKLCMDFIMLHLACKKSKHNKNPNAVNRVLITKEGDICLENYNAEDVDKILKRIL